MKHAKQTAVVYLAPIEKTSQSHALFYRALADYLRCKNGECRETEKKLGQEEKTTVRTEPRWMERRVKKTDPQWMERKVAKSNPRWMEREAAKTGIFPEGLAESLYDSDYRVLEELYPMEVQDGGKPHFPDHPDLFFSISHSGTFWACLFAQQEVGLDLQEEQSHVNGERIAKRFLHQKEQEWLSENDYQDFCRIWAYKESYLKYTGEGIVGGLDRFSLASIIRQADASEAKEGVALIGGESVWQKELPVKEGYHLVCTAETPLTVCLKEFE